MTSLVKVEMKKARLTFEPPSASRAGRALKFRNVGGQILITATLNGLPFNAMVDTGADSTIIGKNLTLRGIAEGSRAMLASLVRAAAANGLTPVIDKVFPFDQAADAYAYLKSGEHLGKVMIKM